MVINIQRYISEMTKWEKKREERQHQRRESLSEKNRCEDPYENDDWLKIVNWWGYRIF